MVMLVDRLQSQSTATGECLQKNMYCLVMFCCLTPYDDAATQKLNGTTQTGNQIRQPELLTE